MVGVLDLARHPDVRRIELAWALSIVGWTSCTVAVLVLAYDEGGAALLAAYSVGRAVWGAVVAVAASSLGDLVRRDRLLRATTGARAALVGSAAALAVVDGPAALVVVAVVAGRRAGRHLPAAAGRRAAVAGADARGARHRERHRHVMESAGSLVGPVLAGVALLLADAPTALALVGRLHRRWPSASLLRLRLPERLPPRPGGRPTMVRDVVVGGAAMARLQPAGGLSDARPGADRGPRRADGRPGRVRLRRPPPRRVVDRLAQRRDGRRGTARRPHRRVRRPLHPAGAHLRRRRPRVGAGTAPHGGLAGAGRRVRRDVADRGRQRPPGRQHVHAPPAAGRPRLIGRLLGALELLIVVGIGLGSVLAPWLLDTVGARGGFAARRGTGRRGGAGLRRAVRPGRPVPAPSPATRSTCSGPCRCSPRSRW